jgi:hypothetical protein
MGVLNMKRGTSTADPWRCTLRNLCVGSTKTVAVPQLFSGRRRPKGSFAVTHTRGWRPVLIPLGICSAFAFPDGSLMEKGFDRPQPAA